MNRVSREWLALREPADAAARASELVHRLTPHLPDGPVLVHDLGCGTGSMARWLAPRLPGPQHWVGHDQDADLLTVAAARVPVSFEPRRSDIARLRPGDLGDATLITASALLDLLTADELAELLNACVAAGCVSLLTLSVVGRVELTPAHPLDARVAAAFDAHQRRDGLLGPDAVATAVAQLRRLGADVLVRPSPWRLGARDPDLAAAWLTGWVGAAVEQQPELAATAKDYARRRLAEAAAGRLEVLVGHADLLALPGPQPVSKRGESA